MTLHLPAPPKADVRKGILLMLLAIVLFTVMDAIAKGLIARYPAPQVVWVRFAGQLALVLLLIGPRLTAALRTRFPVLHLLRSAFQFGATALFFLSLTRIGLAEATALTDLSPVLITLGAALFLGEPLGWSRILGVLLAMAGAMIIIRPGAEMFSPAALMPLGAAVCFAGNALLTRFIGPQESAWTSMIYAAAFGTVVAGFALPGLWVPVATPDLALFGCVGLLGTGAQLCIIRAFSTTEAAVIAPFAYTGIVFAALWGILFYGEYPDVWTVVGASVIVAAGLYVWQQERRR